MTSEHEEYLEIWKKKILGSVKAELSLKQPDFRSRSMTEFKILITAIAKRSIDGFVREFGLLCVEDLHELADDLQRSCFILIVSSLNEVLPLDYPYIIALVYSDQSPGIRLCCMKREKIPGFRDIISSNIVPFLRMKGGPLPESGGINFSSDDVEYSD